MYRYYPEGHRFGVGGGHFLASLVGLLVIALLVAILVMLIINIRRGMVPFPGRHQGARDGRPITSAATPRQDLALEEVRMRYARGEITREEFASISRDLRGGSDTAETS
jgi:uncharacterized membrane protein